MITHCPINSPGTSLNIMCNFPRPDEYRLRALRVFRGSKSPSRRSPRYRSASLSLCGLCLFAAAAVAIATEPPTPTESGNTPPPAFPSEVSGTNETGGVELAAPQMVAYVTNTVYIIPSNTIIRIQVRDSLASGDWFEPVVFKSRTDYKFFRVIFESEAVE